MELLLLGLFWPCSCFVVIAAGALIFATFFGLLHWSQQAHTQAWQEVATRAHLTFVPGNLFKRPHVVGTFRERALKLNTYMTGGAKNRSSWTRITLAVNNPADVYLSLHDEGVLSAIGKMLGAEDVQTGDEEFDRRFVVKSRPPTFATELFAWRGLRLRLMQARSLNVEVKGSELCFEKRGIEKDVNNLLFLFDLLYDLAEAVEQKLEEGR
jgi:hypothetical protein